MTSQRSFTNPIGIFTIAFAIGASVLLVVDAAQAHPTSAGRMDPARMEKMVDRIAKSVDATPEQKAKLMTIAKSAQADIKPLHDQAHARIDKAMTEAKEVLTPEQRTKWDAQMKTMRDRMDRRMGDRANRTEPK